MKKEMDGGAVPSPERMTARAFMQRFGYFRRTPLQVGVVRKYLEEYGLRTVPDFVGIWIDTPISIELVSEDGHDKSLEDPTVRIGELDAAHQNPVSVNRDDEISKATTIMLLNDFSQLPVMQGDRDVKGIVSWKSIGQRYALGQQSGSVGEYMDPHNEVVEISEPLLSALRGITQDGYVLVKGSDGSISGIVTVSDVTEQFIQLTGPFLLIGEIEGHLRNLVFGKFKLEEMAEASLGDGQKIEGPADLTFGGYYQLLGNEDHWNRLGLNVEQSVFREHLNSVREIRNDVMHFNTDGLYPRQVNELQNLANFFRDLTNIGAI